MSKIIVCCNAGISTSLLVGKMQRAVEERGLDVEIEALPLSEAVGDLAGTDLVLLGPQVGFAKAEIESAGGTRAAVIDAPDYARADAGMILDKALEALAS